MESRWRQSTPSATLIIKDLHKLSAKIRTKVITVSLKTGVFHLFCRVDFLSRDP